MSHATDFLETAIGSALFLGQPLPAITEWHIALFTAAPHEDGTGGSEVSAIDTGYARQRLDPGPTHWAKKSAQDANGRTVFYNALAVTFPNVTINNWGDISHFGMLNQSGTLCYVAPLASPRTLNAGDLGPAFLAGELEFPIG
jgi:hypothetical protein